MYSQTCFTSLGQVQVIKKGIVLDIPWKAPKLRSGLIADTYFQNKQILINVEDTNYDKYNNDYPDTFSIVNDDMGRWWGLWTDDMNL